MLMLVPRRFLRFGGFEIYIFVDVRAPERAETLTRCAAYTEVNIAGEKYSNTHAEIQRISFLCPSLTFASDSVSKQEKKESHGTNSSVLSIGDIIIHVAIGVIRSCCMMSSTICIEWSLNFIKHVKTENTFFGFLLQVQISFSNGLDLILVLL